MRRVKDCGINLGTRPLRASPALDRIPKDKEAYITTLLQRSPQLALSRPAMPLVAEQMDLVAAAGLRIIKRDVGFREQFGDPPAMRAADESNSDRGADLK